MSNRTITTSFFCCLALACGDDGDGSDTGGTTGAPTTTMSTSMSSTTPDPTGSSSSGDPSTGSDSGSDSGSGSGSGSGSDSGSDSGSGADVCAQDPEDSECFACTKEMCCAQYAECAADPDCICTVECGLMGTDPGACLEMCNNPPPGPAMALGICAGTTCMSACVPG